MKKNDLLWGLLIVVAVVFALRIIGPLFRMGWNILLFAIVASVIYSFINPAFRTKMLGILNYIKNQIFNK